MFLWSTQTHRVTASCAAHSGAVLSLTAVPGSTLLLTVGRDAVVCVFDMSQVDDGRLARPVSSLRTGTGTFCSGCIVALGSDEARPGAVAAVLPGSEEHLLVVASLPELKEMRVLSPEGGAQGVGMVMKVVPGWRPGEVLALFEGGVALVFDVASGRQLSRQKIGSEPLLCAAVCEDQVTLGAADNAIRVYRVGQDAPQLGEPVRVLTKTKEGTGCAVYRADSKILITGGWDARVRLYDACGGEPLAILREHRKTVSCIATHPTKISFFATAADDARIALWDLYP